MLDSLCRPLASPFFRLRGGAQEHLTCQAVCREVTETFCLTLPTGCLAWSRCWAKNGCLYVGVLCGRECALCAGHFFSSSLNSHACQHTHKALSLTFFYFFIFLSVGSKQTCWLAVFTWPLYRMRLRIACLDSREALGEEKPLREGQRRLWGRLGGPVG